MKKTILSLAVGFCLTAASASANLTQQLTEGVPLQQAIAQALASGHTPAQIMQQAVQASQGADAIADMLNQTDDTLEVFEQLANQGFNLERLVGMLVAFRPNASEELVSAAIQTDPAKARAFSIIAQNISGQSIKAAPLAEQSSAAEPAKSPVTVAAATEPAPDKAKPAPDNAKPAPDNAEPAPDKAELDPDNAEGDIDTAAPNGRNGERLMVGADPTQVSPKAAGRGTDPSTTLPKRSRTKGAGSGGGGTASDN